MSTPAHGNPADAAQMPAAPNSGPAPVPYAGSDYSPQAYGLTFDQTPLTPEPGIEVMSPSPATLGSANAITPVMADIVTPYYAGDISPIYVGGDNDPGGRDIVSGTVQGSIDARQAWYQELNGDLLPQGSTYGDLMPLNDSLLPATAFPPSDPLFTEGDWYGPKHGDEPIPASEQEPL